LLVLFVPLVALGGQARSGGNRGGSPSPSKVRDKDWLKSQIRKRYGTGAMPEKSDPKQTAPPPAEKPSDKPGDSKPQPKSKN
jgi:hypothetical protein